MGYADEGMELCHATSHLCLNFAVLHLLNLDDPTLQKLLDAAVLEDPQNLTQEQHCRQDCRVACVEQG